MRGSPFIRALVMLAVLLALLVPIRHLTGRREIPRPEPVTNASSAETEHSTPIEITTSRIPCRFSIRHLGKMVWSGELTSANASKEIPLAFPTEGIDLVVEAIWQGNEPAAFRVHVESPTGASDEQTIWGEGRASDVLTFR